MFLNNQKVHIYDNHVKFQINLYRMLDRPRDWKCVLYHFIVFSISFASFILSALQTVPLLPSYHTYFYCLEAVLLVVYCCEYAARLWAAGSLYRYKEWRGRLRYCLEFIKIIDLGIILGTVCTLVLGIDRNPASGFYSKFLWIIQAARIIRIDRLCTSWKLLNSTIYTHRKELITAVYIGGIMLFVSSYTVYLAENYREPSTKFETIADALYCCIITVTTVGYGDIHPETWLGKTACICTAIITIPFFALPAGILGSGFALQVQQNERDKHFNRKETMAVSLIQMLKIKLSEVGGTVSTISASEYFLNKFENIVVFHRLKDAQLIQIKIIYTMKLLMFRKKFQLLNNPFDVQDIVNQLSQGYFNIVLKMKELSRSLDDSLGVATAFEEKGRRTQKTVFDSLENLSTRMQKMESILTYLCDALLSNKKVDKRKPSKEETSIPEELFLESGSFSRLLSPKDKKTVPEISNDRG